MGARFSAPVQNSPGAHAASCTMRTGSFPGVKRQGRGVDHPPPSSAEVKERVELYLYSPSGPSWPILGLTLRPLKFNTPNNRDNSTFPVHCSSLHVFQLLKLLKPNDIYICRTAALTSRRYILNIYSTNIHTEYFKHAA